MRSIGRIPPSSTWRRCAGCEIGPGLWRAVGVHPCAGVTTHLRTTVSEIEQYVQGQGAIGDYLAETFKNYTDDHFAWSKEIWDVVAIAYLLNADWVPSNIVSSPIISQRTPADVHNKEPDGWHKHPLTWSFDQSRHQIRCAYYVNRDPVFRDLFTKLADWAKGTIEPAVRS